MKNAVLINDQWLPGQGEPLVSTNPASGEVLWSGQAASVEQVDQAMNAARAAQGAWAQRPVSEREAVLERYQHLLEQESEALARCICAETGKPLWETRTEVTAMVGKVTLSIRAYHERTGTRESGEPANRAALTHRPHGVCAVFGPYNFPGHLPNGHIVPALLAGNTVVFKPSEYTPMVAAYLVDLLQRAGVPCGVINLLPGGLATAKALCAHSQLDGLFFTGSSRTGALIHQQFAPRPDKILALEMGGNNPLIVSDDVDLNAACQVIIQSAYLSAGQRCTCARRLLLPHGRFGDQLLEQLVSLLKQLPIGPPDAEPAPFYATVISQSAADELLTAQQRLLDQGAVALLRMRQLQADAPYLSPGLLDVSSIEPADEEYFGPLLCVQRYTGLEDAIVRANHTRYGLAAGMLTNDEAQWQAFYSQIRAGIVNRNKPLTGASSAAPFGGCGASGNHRASAYYAADYCAYPVASLMADQLSPTQALPPGLQSLQG